MQSSNTNVPPPPPPSSNNSPRIRPGTGGGNMHQHHQQQTPFPQVDPYGRPTAQQQQPYGVPISTPHGQMPSPYGGALPHPGAQHYRPSSVPPPPPHPPPPTAVYGAGAAQTAVGYGAPSVYPMTSYAPPALQSPYGYAGAPSPYPSAYTTPFNPYAPPPSVNVAGMSPYSAYPYDHALAMAYNEGLEGRSHRRHHSSHELGRSSKDVGIDKAQDDDRKWHKNVIEAAATFVQKLPPQILATAVTAAFQGATQSRRPTRKGKTQATTATAPNVQKAKKGRTKNISGVVAGMVTGAVLEKVYEHFHDKHKDKKSDGNHKSDEN